MQSAFPGRPQPKPQALDTVVWDGRRLIAYISRSALVILEGPRQLVQTIYTHDEDDEFEAVAVDPTSGKIAVATCKHILIYRPLGHEYDAPRTNYGQLVQWSLQCELRLDEAHAVTCLSWGLQDELLIGGSYLALIDAAVSNPAQDLAQRTVWSRQLASPVKTALFSHDACLIATTGQYDRLVKIWRRSFGDEHERLDTVYLPHPATVTTVQWRGRPDKDQHMHSVLYTACADGKLRVWADTDHHSLTILSLWCTIDLVGCIQPRTEAKQVDPPRRNFFLIDHWNFQRHLEAAADGRNLGDREQQLRHNLREVADRDAEVCVVVDDQGHLSAWGIERVGQKTRNPSDVLNIAYAEGVNLGLSGCNVDENYALLRGIFSHDAAELHILGHTFSGKIDWYTGYIDQIFDPAPVDLRLIHQGSWTGHASPPEKVVVNTAKTRLAVLTRGLELIVWQRQCGAGPLDDATLSLQSVLRLDRPAVDAWFTDGEDSLMVAHEKQVALWQINTAEASLIGSNDASAAEKDQRKRDAAEDHLARVAGLNDSQQFVVDWGSSRRISLSAEGLLEIASATESRSATRSIPTEIAHAALHIIDSRRAALVSGDRLVLTIWHLDLGLLEYRYRLPSHQPIVGLDWVCSPSGSIMLAVALPHRVVILCQETCNGWIEICQLDISQDSSLPVTTVTWLDTGNVVVSAGTQLFVYSRQARMAFDGDVTLKLDLVGISSLANRSLAGHHPLALEELLCAGQLDLANHILDELDQSLRFYTEGEYLNPLLGIEEVLQVSKLHCQDGVTNQSTNGLVNGFTETSFERLVENLKSSQVVELSSRAQNRLKAVTSTVSVLNKHKSSLDEPALMYLAAFHTTKSASKEDGYTPQMSWRDMVWAQQCDCQDILVTLTTAHLQSKLPWSAARATGMFMWMTEPDALRQQFESVARSEYTKSEDRNPVDCTLYYLALKKKSTLQGLWRLAVGHKERAATMKLLANNFEDARWQTAALKNAYALLGRQRAEYAAAFFLLADRLKDAVGVLEKQLSDLPLAVAVARVYEGDGGPVLRELLETKVLAQAANQGDRWLACWALGLLGRRADALRVLSVPLSEFVSGATERSLLAWRASSQDPLRACTYRIIRGKSSPALSRPRDEEYAMVAQCAQQWAQRGHHVLALHLVAQWRFEPVQAATLTLANRTRAPERNAPEPNAPEPTALGRGQANQAPPAPGTMVDGQLRKVVMEEPSASSILDSFDF